MVTGRVQLFYVTIRYEDLPATTNKNSGCERVKISAKEGKMYQEFIYFDKFNTRLRSRRATKRLWATSTESSIKTRRRQWASSKCASQSSVRSFYLGHRELEKKGPYHAKNHLSLRRENGDIERDRKTVLWRWFKTGREIRLIKMRAISPFRRPYNNTVFKTDARRVSPPPLLGFFWFYSPVCLSTGSRRWTLRAAGPARALRPCHGLNRLLYGRIIEGGNRMRSRTWRRCEHTFREIIRGGLSPIQRRAFSQLFKATYTHSKFSKAIIKCFGVVAQKGIVCESEINVEPDESILVYTKPKSQSWFWK